VVDFYVRRQQFLLQSLQFVQRAVERLVSLLVSDSQVQQLLLSPGKGRVGTAHINLHGSLSKLRLPSLLHNNF
jgi:hypothetical protein